MIIEYLQDINRLSQLATDIVVSDIADQKRFNIGLPTGSTPVGFYQNLITRSVDWGQVRTFNLDEYIIDHNHPGSYHTYMQKHLFQHTDIKSENQFFPTIDYDSIIEQHGGLDLTVLGLGHNGHIAFNEPGSDRYSQTRTVFLSDLTQVANSRFFDNIPTPRHAITMGIDTILRSKKILLLVQGTLKLEILKKAVWGEITEQIPASFLQTHDSVRILYCD